MKITLVQMQNDINAIAEHLVSKLIELGHVVELVRGQVRSGCGWIHPYIKMEHNKLIEISFNEIAGTSRYKDYDKCPWVDELRVSIVNDGNSCYQPGKQKITFKYPTDPSDLLRVAEKLVPWAIKFNEIEKSFNEDKEAKDAISCERQIERETFFKLMHEYGSPVESMGAVSFDTTGGTKLDIEHVDIGQFDITLRVSMDGLPATLDALIKSGVISLIVGGKTDVGSQPASLEAINTGAVFITSDNN